MVARPCAQQLLEKTSPVSGAQYQLALKTAFFHVGLHVACLNGTSFHAAVKTCQGHAHRMFAKTFFSHS